MAVGDVELSSQFYVYVSSFSHGVVGNFSSIQTEDLQRCWRKFFLAGMINVCMKGIVGFRSSFVFLLEMVDV